MIIFLTLCYVGVVFLLIKFRVLPNNIYVKGSPIAFLILLFLFLFVPLQWGAPAGPAVIIRNSIAIVPNVAGQVTEVLVQPNKPVKKGDVLFRIDPTQYQAKVDQVAAQLKFSANSSDRHSVEISSLLPAACQRGLLRHVPANSINSTKRYLGKLVLHYGEFA